MAKHLPGVASCPWTGVPELPNSKIKPETGNKRGELSFLKFFEIIVPLHDVRNEFITNGYFSVQVIINHVFDVNTNQSIYMFYSN